LPKYLKASKLIFQGKINVHVFTNKKEEPAERIQQAPIKPLLFSFNPFVLLQFY
jgi:hypothetical protein